MVSIRSLPTTPLGGIVPFCTTRVEWEGPDREGVE